MKATFLAWLPVLACLGAERAPAQTVTTNEYPRAVNAIIVPESEANDRVSRAAIAMRAGQPDRVVPLLQNVMQADPAALVSTNGFTFRPARKLVAELIRALPERIRDAHDLAAQAPEEPRPGQKPAPADRPPLEALSWGTTPGAATGETGLRLAGLYLDQDRFADARRVLLDLLDETAGAESAPRSDVLARLAVACARVGDAVQARWAWAENEASTILAHLRPAA